jgi:hypothetical protein
MNDLSPFRDEDRDCKRPAVWRQKRGPSSDALYTSPLRWMRLAIYCQLSGDSADAVHARRRKRQWVDGRHCRVGPDGNLWVNPEEVNKWVESEPSANSSARAA